MMAIAESKIQGSTPTPQPDSVPVIRIEHTSGWLAFGLGDLWEHRELLYFLVWRDVKVRYKQTVLGAVWAVLPPIMSMVIFTVIFAYLAKMPSDGSPYPIFTFTALLPWNYFSGALGRVTNSVVGNAQLVSKVYFPRLIIPLSGVISGLVDFAISFVILLAMMVWYRIQTHMGDGNIASLLNPGHGNRFRGRSLARRAQYEIPGCWIRHSIPDSILDVCLSGCLSRQSSAGEVAVALQPQPDGWCH